ncbi:transcriptional regulator, LacI family [Paramicrobacterium humi]|uniref:Transcriptional regulator, LacI family n=1 Tax=Paramicrobacterium humi TaxID=640635 RepID=A0A1H4M4U4_9MICO|nr:LacI family DNA-binding transcriptional regulator [Microbacterium humi]SEB77788.1 transcriptional regulator, LacI family [Microbacterium humi]
MGPTGKRPTLADVAERSGLSKTAVSLVLNERPGSRLSDEAAARIRTAAAELGYKPNPAAQSLRLGKTKTIGFISDEVTITRYASGMIRGVLGTAKELDHTVLIAETARHMEDLGTAMDAMRDRNVDGILVGLMGARVIDIPLPDRKTPVVIVNGRTPDEVPSILPDEYEAGRSVARELIGQGHSRIGIIGDLPRIVVDPRKTATIGVRFRGIDDALDAAGITPVRVDLEDWSPAIGYSAAITMLRSNPDLTAILAGNDNVAFGAYQALTELGRRVPDDISVISFDDDELASYLRPGLTTCRLPYEQMASLGVEMVLGKTELAHRLVPMPLIRRGSVAPAAAATEPAPV